MAKKERKFQTLKEEGYSEKKQRERMIKQKSKSQEELEKEKKSFHELMKQSAVDSGKVVRTFVPDVKEDKSDATEYIEEGKYENKATRVLNRLKDIRAFNFSAIEKSIEDKFEDSEKEDLRGKVSKYNDLIIKLSGFFNEEEIDNVVSQVKNLISVYEAEVEYRETDQYKTSVTDEKAETFDKFGVADVSGIENKLVVLKGIKYFLSDGDEFDDRLLNVTTVLLERQWPECINISLGHGKDKIIYLYKIANDLKTKETKGLSKLIKKDEETEGEKEDEVQEGEKDDKDYKRADKTYYDVSNFRDELNRLGFENEGSLSLSYSFFMNPKEVLTYDEEIEIAVDLISYHNKFYEGLINDIVPEDLYKPDIKEEQVPATEAPEEKKYESELELGEETTDALGDAGHPAPSTEQSYDSETTQSEPAKEIQDSAPEYKKSQYEEFRKKNVKVKFVFEEDDVKIIYFSEGSE